MKFDRKLLLIFLPLLFFSLFFTANNTFASYSLQGYYEGWLDQEIEPHSSCTNYSTEYTSDQFATLAPGQYPYLYGTCSNTACKGWQTAYTGDLVNLMGGIGDPKIYVNYNITVPGTTNYNYYGPGYYMFRIRYPEQSEDWSNECTFNYWNSNCGPVYHQDSFTDPGPYPGYGFPRYSYVPVYLPGSGGTNQIVSLSTSWTAGRMWLTDDNGDYPASHIYFNIAYTPIAHDGVCGNNSKIYNNTGSFVANQFCLTLPGPVFTNGSNFPTNDNPTVAWTCPGSLGGYDVGCAAQLKIDGVCGTTTNGQYFYAKPTGTTLCDSGAPSAVSGKGTTAYPWIWTCNGINGGASSGNCSANIKIDGECGTYTNGLTLSAKPTGDNNLCDFGKAINFVDNGSSWTWYCDSSFNGVSYNGSNSPQCSASLGASTNAIDGVCGPAAITYYSGSALEGAKCTTAGTSSPANPAFPTINNPITWTCPGVNGGQNSPICTAMFGSSTNPGVCGIASGKTYDVAPSGGILCDAESSPSAVNGTGPWSWTCTNNGICGTAVSCSAFLTNSSECGTNANVFPADTTTFFGTFCADHVIPVPAVPAFPMAAPYFTTWTCNGVSCKATLKVNGVCGPAAQP